MLNWACGFDAANALQAGGALSASESGDGRGPLLVIKQIPASGRLDDRKRQQLWPQKASGSNT
eukprot:7943588-Alexandrium_andersonii.AAC.1